MARRDVELVVRAKDEASRALDSISASLETLRNKQSGTAGSSGMLGASLVQAAAQLAKFEQATGLVVAASDRAEAALARQRSGMSETAAALAAVNAQMANVRASSERIQSAIVDTKRGGGDTTKQVAALAGARQELGALESQQKKLTGALNGQQSVLGQQEQHFRELASMANSAEAALESFGDSAQRSGLASAAGSEAAAAAFRDEAAAARMARARASFNGPTAADRGPAFSASNSALADQLRQEDALVRSTQALIDQTEPLAAIQRKLTADLGRLKVAKQQQIITDKQYIAAEAELTRQSKEAAAAVNRVGRGDKGAISLFGLKPYELTNLGYQVNDLITQVASGTPIMQAFAQQGGQILQLLPGIGTKLIGAFKSPPLLLAAATVGVFAAGLARASDNADRLRKVEGLLAGIAGGAKTSATELTKTVKAIEQLGIKSEDALKITRSLLREGLDPEQMKAYVRVAQSAAKITGDDLTKAVEDMQTAFSGGYEQVAALDDAMQFLTVTEREEIRALFDSGRATEARTRALQIYQGKMREVAKESAGTWATATDGLEKSFDRLLDRLADTTPIKAFATAMTNLVGDFATALTDINNLTDAQLDREIALLKAQRERQAAFNTSPENSALVKQYDTAIARLEAAKVKLAAPLLAPGVNTAQQKLDSDYRRDRDLRQQEQSGKTRAERIAAAGQIAYQEALNKGLSEAVALEDKRLAIKKAAREEDKKAADEAKRRNKEETFVLRAPVKQKFSVSSGFDLARRNPVTGKVRPHPAIDIPLPVGTPVYASAPGRVVETDRSPAAAAKPGNGRYVMIDHGAGTKTTLLHLSDSSIVNEGDIVEGGQLIGKSGGKKGAPGAGTSTGPHLDFRLTVDGKPVDPRRFLGKDVPISRGGAVADQQKAEEERAGAQLDFERSLDREADAREASTQALQAQSLLSGEALLDAQREQAVSEAIAKAQQEAGDKGLLFDAKRQKALEDSVRAEFDIVHARERAEIAITELTAKREAILARVELLRANGDSSGLDKLQADLTAIDKALLDLLDKERKSVLLSGINPVADTQALDLQNRADQIKRDALNRERDAVQAPVDRLGARRQALQEQVDFFTQTGQASVVAQLTDQLRLLDKEYLTAIDRAIAWYAAQTGPEAEAALANLIGVRQQVIAAGNQFAITGGQIRDIFTSSFTDSFKLFAQRLTETKDLLGSLGQGVISFAASFIEKLAEMSLQALAFKAASKLGFSGFADKLNGTLGLADSGGQLIAAGAALTGSGAVLTTAAGLWQGVTIQLQAAAAALLAAGVAANGAKAVGAVSAGLAGLFHEGGIAGSATRHRAADPAWFANARRYHGGGIAGLAADEVPAILRRGEEVLTTADRRHRANDNGGGPSGGSISQVLAIGDDEIAGAVAGASGERVVLTHIRRNRETIRQMLA